MSRATPQMREIAKRLISHETEGNRVAGTPFPAAIRVCEHLRPHLATLMGTGGFSALLTRALSMASAENPWLRAMRVKGDGTLDGLDQPEAKAPPLVVAEGGVVLVAHLLGLLTAFVGENLTLRMVREVWPQLPTGNSDLEPGD